MPSITNNKGTTSAIFYNRGIPNSDKMFAYLATQNYAAIKTINRYYKNNNLSHTGDTNSITIYVKLYAIPVNNNKSIKLSWKSNYDDIICWKLLKNKEVFKIFKKKTTEYIFEDIIQYKSTEFMIEAIYSKINNKNIFITSNGYNVSINKTQHIYNVSTSLALSSDTSFVEIFTMGGGGGGGGGYYLDKSFFSLTEYWCWACGGGGGGSGSAALCRIFDVNNQTISITVGNAGEGGYFSGYRSNLDGRDYIIYYASTAGGNSSTSINGITMSTASGGYGGAGNDYILIGDQNDSNSNNIVSLGGAGGQEGTVSTTSNYPVTMLALITGGNGGDSGSNYYETSTTSSDNSYYMTAGCDGILSSTSDYIEEETGQSQDYVQNYKIFGEIGGGGGGGNFNGLAGKYVTSTGGAGGNGGSVSWQDLYGDTITWNNLCYGGNGSSGSKDTTSSFIAGTFGGGGGGAGATGYPDKNPLEVFDENYEAGQDTYQITGNIGGDGAQGCVMVIVYYIMVTPITPE